MLKPACPHAPVSSEQISASADLTVLVPPSIQVNSTVIADIVFVSTIVVTAVVVGTGRVRVVSGIVLIINIRAY